MQTALPSAKNRYKDHIALAAGAILIITLLFISDAPAQKIREALSICAKAVIPSVFPFMVISSFFIKLGGGKVLGRMFSLPSKLLFGTSENAACAVILGFLCGYPIGASCASELYDRGEISKNELQRILTFINNPSSAFVIGGVGAGLFGSIRLGKILYFSVLLSACTAGILSRFFKKDEEIRQCRSDNAELSVSRALTEAISSSALGMLNICGCVCFFSVPSAIISDIFDISERISALVSGIFEISGGAAAAAEIRSLPLCAAVCAWSGLSVFLQVVSVCRGRRISFFPLLLSKLFQALICPLYVVLLSRLL